MMGYILIAISVMYIFSLIFGSRGWGYGPSYGGGSSLSFFYLGGLFGGGDRDSRGYSRSSNVREGSNSRSRYSSGYRPGK